MLSWDDRSAPPRGPRHAAGVAPFLTGFAGTAAGLAGAAVAGLAEAARAGLTGPARTGSAAETARHRRPVSPTDSLRLGPIFAMRDVVAETVPVAKKAAGAVREWALYTADRPPAIGTHRAPGTLPIESWLLVGKARQQALLASVAAAGVMLVVVPMQHSTGAIPVSAAERAAAAQGRGVPIAKPTGSGKHAVPAAVAPAGSQPTAAPGRSAGKPATGTHAATVPPGTGPAHSLRTTGSTAVALTFDDGPDPVETPKILAMLARFDIKATFCLVGEQVEKHPEIVRQIVAAGHTLCNHTWNHSLAIGKHRTAEIEADLRRTNDAIHAAAPGTPITFFRAPGGNFTDRLVKVALNDGMTSLYWQVDPRDWDHPEGENETKHVDRVVDGIKAAVKPGSIVLSHDFNQPDTIKAYETLLPWLKHNFKLGPPPRNTPPVTTAPATPPVSPVPSDTPAPTPSASPRAQVDDTASQQAPAPAGTGNGND
ncbi:MAG: peptidoglycan-N-acetylglucosamine deacetylase [Actinoplanes sp.]|nr:peptidoglycan-N-acetylglucosamine deacetylase [Actinoplanes sp.]